MNMSIKTVTAIIVCTLALATRSQSRAVSDGWLENFEEAISESAREGKHMLVVASASDDPWVVKETAPLKDTAFVSKAKKKFVLFMVDLPNDPSRLSGLAESQNPALRRSLSLIPYPGRVLVVNCEGNVIKRMEDVRGGSYSRWRKIEASTANMPKAVKRSTAPALDNIAAMAAKGMKSGEKPRKDAFYDPNPPEKIPGTGKSTPDGWMDDFFTAQQIAERERKLLFVVFSGSDWCGWCKKYADELLRKSAFQNAVKDRYVLVYIDSPRDKSLLSAKCLEQNSMVKDMLGAAGSVPETIIATASGDKLVSIKGCGHVERGADSFLEFFNPIDKSLSILAAARKKAVEAGEGSAAADEILRKAYLDIDEAVLIDHFRNDVYVMLSRRSDYFKDFPYFQYVMPVQKEFEALRSEMKSVASRAAYGSNRRFDRDKHAAAQRDFYNEKIGDKLVSKWLEAISAAESKVTGVAHKRMIELRAKVMGLKNSCH